MEHSKQHIRHCILFCYQMKKGTTHAMQLINSTLGENTVGHSTVKKWYSRFRQGQFSLEDNPRLGTPKLFKDEELCNLLDENPCQTREELAKKLGVSRTTISLRLNALLGKRKITETYPRQCSECDEILENSGAYDVHQQYHVKKWGSADDEEVNSCCHCFKVFSTKYLLMKHMERYKTTTIIYTSKFRTYWCDKCNKACRGYTELEEHKKEHEFDDTNEIKDPSTSNITEELNNEEITIKSEEMDEEGENGNNANYLCNNEEFNTEDELNNDEHIQIKQEVVDEEELSSEIHICTLCDEVFTKTTQLEVHMEWHKQSKNSCNICQRNFNNEIALEVHNMEFHQNKNQNIDESPLKCETCDIEYETQTALDKHLEFHKIVEEKKKEGIKIKEEYIEQYT